MKSIIQILFKIINCFFTYVDCKKIKRIKDEIKSFWIMSRFDSCPDSVRFGSIMSLQGEKYIRIGERTTFCDALSLSAWSQYGKQSFTPNITIGNDCSIGAYNNITCINKIQIGDGFLSGKWVTITDNAHGSSDFKSLMIFPSKRIITTKGTVIIGRNVWVGDKATILPGVKIGDCSIIAANSVVTKDIPSFCVAAGNPAKIIKEIPNNEDIIHI